MKLLPFRRPGVAGRRREPPSPEEAAAARRKRWTTLILAVGFASAIAIFVAALIRAPSENPLGYDPMDTKQYRHDLEVYGGQASVLAEQFQNWFVGLWKGRNLAYTVAVSTLLLVWIVRFFGRPAPEEDAEDPAAQPERPGPDRPVPVNGSPGRRTARPPPTRRE